MSSRRRSRSRSPRRRSKSPRRKRSSQESLQASNRRQSSPRGRHSDQEENKTSSRAGKNDNGKDTGREVIEDNQAEQRTDRFKSERFDSNDNASDATSKDWRNSEGERRGGGRGYRGRGPAQQEWRDSNKLQESLSDPTHVPRLGQFFEHDNRDAPPPRPRPSPHDAPPPNGDQSNQSAGEGVNSDERREERPKDSRWTNTNRGRGGPDHGWGGQGRRRGNSPEVWKHDLFDVFDHSPSPDGEEGDGEGSVQCKSVVQKVTGGEDKWVHDKFETEVANDKREGRDGRGMNRGKWLHDKFEAGGERREGRGPHRGSSRWLHDKFERSREGERRDHGGRSRRWEEGERRDAKEKSPRSGVSDRWGKRDGNKVPSKEDKTVPMETST